MNEGIIFQRRQALSSLMEREQLTLGQLARRVYTDKHEAKKLKWRVERYLSRGGRDPVAKTPLPVGDLTLIARAFKELQPSTLYIELLKGEQVEGVKKAPAAKKSSKAKKPSAKKVASTQSSPAPKVTATVSCPKFGVTNKRTTSVELGQDPALGVVLVIKIPLDSQFVLEKLRS